MINDGLQNKHRFFELLVCDAGNSIMKEKRCDNRKSTYDKFKDNMRIARDEKNPDKVKKIGQEYKKITDHAEKKHPPSIYSKPAKQIKPLGLQFFESLKRNNFSPIVRSYAGEVSKIVDRSYTVNIKITKDLHLPVKDEQIFDWS
jgi:hypothetical protein